MNVLPTFSDLPTESPLTKALSGLPDAEQARIARDSVGLGEVTGRMLLHIRGQQVDIVLQQTDMKIGDAKASEQIVFARLRRDEFFWLGPKYDLSSNFLVRGSHQVVQTDITHGRSVLLLVGSEAAEVLAKVCALDFADAQFPNLHAAQSSLAKVRTLIIRADIEETPAYGLIVDRSLAAYVWDVVFDATREFSGIALNGSGIDYLRKTTLW